MNALDSGSSGHSLWGFKSPFRTKKRPARVFSFFCVCTYGLRHAGRASVVSPSACVFPCGSRTCTVCTEGRFFSVATMLLYMLIAPQPEQSPFSCTLASPCFIERYSVRLCLHKIGCERFFRRIRSCIECVDGILFYVFCWYRS